MGEDEVLAEYLRFFLTILYVMLDKLLNIIKKDGL